MIDSFMRRYRFLSNFHPAAVILDGVTYLTVENAYQAAKIADPTQRPVSLTSCSPSEAKRFGNKVAFREDWEDVKLEIMEDLVHQKFTKHQHLRKRLLATGDEELIEGNWWGDVFWGVCRGKGKNHLGKILMKIRAELRAEAELLMTV